MKLSLRSFTVTATDPEAEWRCDVVQVRAVSEDDAKRVARVAFARVRRDHWSVTAVHETVTRCSSSCDVDGLICSVCGFESVQPLPYADLCGVCVDGERRAA